MFIDNSTSQHTYLYTISNSARCYHQKAAMASSVMCLLTVICVIGIVGAFASLADTETQLIHGVMSHFHIGRIILVTSNLRDENTVKRMKFLMERKIMAVVMDVNCLLEYFHNRSTHILPSNREAIVGGLHFIAASGLLSWVGVS